MESYNALGRLILLCLIGAIEGKFFALPSNWKVAINNSSFPTYSTVQGPFRAVTDGNGNGNAIVSENDRFGLGFIDINSSGKFVLSVVIGLNLTLVPAMEVWTANRNRTVAEGALLKLGIHGNLLLEDSDGTVVWSIGSGKCKGILMAKNGNFQIFNTTNISLVSAGSNLVWQSWDHPTHTLLPGQELKRGQTLISNTSATNTSYGSYKLVMEPGGLVLFYTSSIQEPYWSMGLQGLDYQGILSPCFYNSSYLGPKAVYTGQDLQVSFNETMGKSSSFYSCANGNRSTLSMAPLCRIVMFIKVYVALWSSSRVMLHCDNAQDVTLGSPSLWFLHRTWAIHFPLWDLLNFLNYNCRGMKILFLGTTPWPFDDHPDP